MKNLINKKWIWIALAAVLIVAVVAVILCLHDFQPPEVTVQNLMTYCGQTPRAEDFIVSCEDAGDCTIKYQTEPNENAEGDQTVTIIVTDETGNETICTAVLTSILDDTPPVITGAQNRLHFVGTEFDPLENIFVQDNIDKNPEITVLSDVDPDVPGEYAICYEATDFSGNMSYQIIRVDVFQDDTAPVITTALDENISDEHCLLHFVGTEFDPMEGVSVEDDLDPAPQISEVNNVKPEVPGEYTIRYKASDASGNESFAVVKVRVIRDETPPVIYGIYDLSAYAGGTISYKKNVKVTDDYDPSPVITVDSSDVDMSTPGEYTVIYTATDASGNVTTEKAPVTVRQQNDKWVDEATIQAAVKELASRILTDDMTPREQVEAIYNWTHSRVYNGLSDKTDWRQAGYQLIKTGCGDCFSFFGASKLLFEYCGIPNIDVRRLRLPFHYSDHYWSMVSIDGGKNYYYFDATALFARVCLMTDAQIDYYSPINGYYYNRDRSVIPDTPENPPE